MSGDVQIKITWPHNDEKYHEWTFVRMEKIDRRGHPNPRMGSADWQFWICNNPDCGAQAVVSNDVIRSLLGPPEPQEDR